MLVSCAMNGNAPVKCILPVDDHIVSSALELSRSFALTARLPAETADRLAIVVEELLLNLIEHGNARGEIHLTLAVLAAAVSLTIIDAGTPYDPRNAGIPAQIPARGGGAGLALVAAWARIVDYRHADGRNRLELVLPIPAAPYPIRNGSTS